MDERDAIDGSPWSGRVTALATDPRNAQVAYLGAAEGGVWKTSDGGSSWVPLFDNQPSLAIGALAVDPVNPDTVYAGTGEANLNGDGYYGLGLFKSFDGGASWLKTGGTIFDNCHISAITVHPTNPAVILVGSVQFSGPPAKGPCNGGVYRSTDSGATWTRVVAALEANSVVVDPTNPSVWYAAAATFSSDPGGVFKSIDAGVTWTKLGGGLPADVGIRVQLAVAPTNSHRLYAALGRDSAPFVMTSNNAGANWTSVSSVTGCYQCFYNLTIAADPTTSGVFYYGTGAIQRFTGAGTAFSYVNGLHADQHALAFDRSGRLWIGDDGGAYRSDDGGASAVSLNATLAITQFYPGMGGPTGGILTGGTQDNGTLRFNSENPSWDHIVCCDGGFSAVDPNNPGIIYAETQFGNIIKTSDGGASYQSGNNGLSPAYHNFIEPLVIDPVNPQRLYAGQGNQIWRTIDGANSWGAISPALGDINNIAPAKSDPSTLYAAGSGAVFVTRNGGTSWSDSRGILPSLSFSDVAVDPANADHAYVTNSQFSAGHVFETLNGGGSWSDITGDLPDTPTSAVAIDTRVTPPILYIGTDVGVFASPDDGASWSRFASGLPNSAVMDVVLDQVGNRLVATTHGRGAFAIGLGAPPLTVTAPNGNESFAAGSKQTIRWTYTSGTGPTVRIDLLFNNVVAATATAGTSVGSNGSGTFSWTLPAQAAGRHYRIWVHSTTVPGGDVSDSEFGIVGSSSPGAFAWGYNSNGQLGGGGGPFRRPRPAAISGLGAAVPVTGPYSSHALAIKTDGSVVAWGWNGSGQLGDGSNSDRDLPVPVQGLGPNSGVVSVAAGEVHSLALKSDGSVLAWGDNSFGQLGDGTKLSRSAPVQVSGLGPGSGVIAIAAGALHNLALKANGTVVAWGSNDQGQLGDGSNAERTSPVTVQGQGPGSGTIQIATGGFASFLIRSDGSVLSWGGNGEGELGDGTTDPRSTPGPVSGLGAGSAVAALAPGGFHVLALRFSGQVLAWGNNGFGQLGSSVGAARLAPAPIAAFDSGPKIVGVAAGGVHSLAVAIDGSLYAWGDNSLGQLGDGTVTLRSSPERVVRVLGVTQISAGSAFTVARNAASMVPTVGGPSTGVLAVANGFRAGESVTVRYATGLSSPQAVVVCSVTAASDGTAACGGSIPMANSAGAPGTHRITFRGQISGVIEKTTFILV